MVRGLHEGWSQVVSMTRNQLRWMRRHRVAMIAGGIVVLALVALGVWALRAGKEPAGPAAQRGADIRAEGESPAPVWRSGWNPAAALDEARRVVLHDLIDEVLARSARRMDPASRARLSAILIAEGQRVGVDPLLLAAVVDVESGYAPTAVSHRGARGLMQVMPETAAEVARKLGMVWTGPEQLDDPKLNVRLGAQYLAWLLERYAGNVRFALTAYNRGPASLRRIVRARGLTQEHTGYYRKVQDTYRTYQRQLRHTATPLDHTG